MMGKKRLASLDLFSGIGGITHALRDFCIPVGYCDWEEEARKVLKGNMTKRLLPRAPVCHDVRSLDAAWFKTHDIKTHAVDIVVGGFPCVGFSPLGSRQGVENAETGLFFEIMRILDLTNSPYVFLENVPNLLTLGMDVVSRELSKRGYELRWCVVSAAQMGAPHERKRWFCLGVKQHAKFAWTLRSGQHNAFSWSGTGPSRTVAKDSAKARVRTSLLGNSVVPDAVRYAFVFLIGRCQGSAKVQNRAVMLVPATSAIQAIRVKKHDTFPPCGILRVDSVLEEFSPPVPDHNKTRRTLSLIFDPQAFRSKKPASPLLTSGLIKKPLLGRSWATPRHGMLRACNYLTSRSIRDLPTQIRFEKRTIHREGGVSPEFVEWLMGYPRRWTHS